MGQLRVGLAAFLAALTLVLVLDLMGSLARQDALAAQVLVEFQGLWVYRSWSFRFFPSSEKATARKRSFLHSF